MSGRILLLCLLTMLCGCSGGCEEQTDPASKNGSDPPSQPKVTTPLLKGFEKPAFALVLSGEQHGYLEPCGCSETQSGGVARRQDLLRQLADRGWEVAGLDLGGTLKRSREQSKIKFAAIVEALQGMKYKALGLGPEELGLSGDQLILNHVGTEGEPQVNFVSANVTLFGSADLGTPIRFRSFELGGQKVVVTSIVSPALTKFIPYLQDPNQMSLEEPATALTAIKDQVAAEKPALAVLLSHASLEESKQLAQKFPEYQLILSAGGVEDGEREPIMEGKTMIVQVGHKGKCVGVCAFYPEAEQPLKFELVNLDKDRFKNAPEMIEVMRNYQERLRNENILERDPSIPHKSGNTYVGVAKCAECHKKAYDVWKTSKHSHAYESLEKGRPGQEANWVTRVFDPECIACHTTGWEPQEVLRFESGFVTGEITPLLKGQQCENCHGPGSHHVDLEEQYKADRKSVTQELLIAERKNVQLTEIKAVKQVCFQCHDTDNSPNFDFEKYWAKIKHVGRD